MSDKAQQVHEVLVKARNIIERDGWVRFQLNTRQDGVPHCALGAIRTAGAATPLADQMAAAILGEREPDPNMTRARLMEWNDRCRTKEEVLAAFDRAIAATAPEPADPFPTLPAVESREQPHALRTGGLSLMATPKRKEGDASCPDPHTRHSGNDGPVSEPEVPGQGETDAR